MNINHFTQVTGEYIESIEGQSRFGYVMDGNVALYEAQEYVDSPDFKGSLIRFYDLVTGEVYTPFARDTKIVYGDPIHIDGAFYFIQLDFNTNLINVIRYFPKDVAEVVVYFNLNDVDYGEINLFGPALHVLTREEDKYICYYPSQFEINVGEQEDLIFIDEDGLYLSKWVEEGYEADGISPDYHYYEKLLLRDFNGHLICEEVGHLSVNDQGEFWLS